MTEEKNEQQMPVDPVNPITGKIETQPQTTQEPEEETIQIPEGDDDGSLAFLQIPNDTTRRQFNCPEITQQKLVNTSFWIIDYYE